MHAGAGPDVVRGGAAHGRTGGRPPERRSEPRRGAREALAVPGLLQRLGDGRGWHPGDLAYAREAQRVHTARVLSALDPAKGTLSVAGYYHFRHSERSVLDGIQVRQEILDRDGSADALAVLDLGDDVPRFEAVAMG
ncbi:hypothetical protein [Streptomyces kronopolitis]|uniref:hypothetical protein n=1 Tax=Streptomyces kronopolitis TaxID=1612435 RepID=UPI003D971702